MPEFILEIGDSVQRRVVQGSKITFGREDNCEIVIDDGSISRRHALVEKKSGRWLLRDLESGNGVFVDGQKVRRVVLSRGTQFALGDVVVVTFLPDHEDEALEDKSDVNKSESEDVGNTVQVEDAPKIAEYDVVEFLGEGPRTRAFSYLKKGSSKATCLRQILDDDKGAWTKLVNEWNEVDHEGVARLDLVFAEDGGGLVRERLADLGTLADFLQIQGRIDSTLGLKIGRGLASALDALHDSGIRLGALRCEKVRMASEDGRVRISGPARLVVDPRRVPENEAGILSCTAPEFFAENGAGRPTRAGDIFSLGAILHQIFTGCAVGEGKTIEGIKRSIERGIIKTPDDRRRGLPEGLSELICACLALDPRKRPLTVSDVSATLGGMSAKAAARAPSRPVQASERELGQRQAVPPKSIRHRTISWTITIFFLLIVNGIVALLLWDKFDIFATSDDEFESMTKTLSDGESDAGMSPLRKEVDRFTRNDHFDDALLAIRSALTGGLIKTDEASLLKDKVNRSRRARVLQLTNLIERAVKVGKPALAGSYLQSLEAVVGSSDEEYLRLKALVGG